MGFDWLWMLGHKMFSLAFILVWNVGGEKPLGAEINYQEFNIS